MICAGCGSIARQSIMDCRAVVYGGCKKRKKMFVFLHFSKTDLLLRNKNSILGNKI